MHHGNVLGKGPIGFFPEMFGFLHPGCYAAIVNKTNIRNNNEDHVNRLIFDLPEHYSCLAYIKTMSNP